MRKALQSKRGSTHYAPIVDHDDEPPRKSNGPQDLPQSSSSTSLMDEPTAGLENEDTERVASPEDALDNWETAKLGLEFCLLWVCHQCALHDEPRLIFIFSSRYEFLVTSDAVPLIRM